jgi:hypothetical protein
MKKSMLLMLAILLTCAFVLTSCGDSDSTGPDNPPVVNPVSETVKQEISKDFDGADLEFTFENGLTVYVNAADNPSVKGKITIRLMDEEQFFNGDNLFVLDFAKTAIDVKYKYEIAALPNLVKEDISIISYSPDESLQELKAGLINFNYDAVTGLINGEYNFAGKPSSGKGATLLAGKDYSRIVVSYTDRMKMAEGDEELALQMPFYEQPGSSCWATCAEMMSHAYANPKDNYYTNKITEFVKYIGHNSLNEGIGLWDFKRNLTKAVNLYGKTNTEVSTFVSKSSLLEEIITKLNEQKPMILNLTYPNVGRHAVMVIGYKKEQISASKLAVKLLIHNPQNMSGEAMNKWVDFDWLMKEKAMTEAYQILYSNSAMPTRTPVTVGMPIERELGDMNFVVSSKGKKYTIGMVYDKAQEDGYSWAFANGDICKVLPDTSSAFAFSLPVYNAGAADKELNYTIKMINNTSGKTVAEIKETHTATMGNSKIEGELPINIYGGSDVVKGAISVTIEDKSTGAFLDGFRIDFQIDRRNLIILPYFSLDYVKLVDDNGVEYYNMDVAISDLPLKRSGKAYSGSRTRTFVNSWGDQVLAEENLEFAFDKEDNPTNFNYINVFITYSHAVTGKLAESYNIKFVNVPAKLARQDIKGWYSVKGDDVCGNIDFFEVIDSGVFTNYKCSSTSGMSINFVGF